MTELDLDVRLVGTGSLLSLSSKIHIIEEIINSLGLKYSKWFCDINDRNDRRQRKSRVWDDYTCIFEIECSEDYYKFLLYLIKERFEKVDILNRRI